MICCGRRSQDAFRSVTALTPPSIARARKRRQPVERPVGCLFRRGRPEHRPLSAGA